MKRQRCDVKPQHRFFKTHAGDKQIDAQGRNGGADFKIGQKDDSQMNGIDSIGIGNRGEQGNHDHQR